jgi:GDP-L-fucose synthase
MQILVTGATGFLGTTLCNQLESNGHSLERLNSQNADLTKYESLTQFSDRQYDQIYHLAAWTQAGDFCLYHPGEQWIINQQINTNILTWWQRSQPQAKLICMGTSCAYDPN